MEKHCALIVHTISVKYNNLKVIRYIAIVRNMKMFSWLPSILIKGVNFEQRNSWNLQITFWSIEYN